MNKHNEPGSSDPYNEVRSSSFIENVRPRFLTRKVRGSMNAAVVWWFYDALTIQNTLWSAWACVTHDYRCLYECDFAHDFFYYFRTINWCSMHEHPLWGIKNKCIWHLRFIIRACRNIDVFLIFLDYGSTYYLRKNICKYFDGNSLQSNIYGNNRNGKNCFVTMRVYLTGGFNLNCSEVSLGCIGTNRLQFCSGCSSYSLGILAETSIIFHRFWVKPQIFGRYIHLSICR